MAVKGSPMLVDSHPSQQYLGLHWTDIWLQQELPRLDTSGQSYKQFMLINYDSRVVPDLKTPHIMTLGS